MRQSGMGINQVVNQILRDKSKIAPIVVIREGSRVFISPNTDIFFPIPRENEVIAEFLKWLKKCQFKNAIITLKNKREPSKKAHEN